MVDSDFGGIPIHEPLPGAQRVVAGAGQGEHIPIPQRAGGDDGRRHRPDGGVAVEHQIIEAAAERVGLVVGQQLGGFVGDDQHPASGGQFTQRIEVHAGLLVVEDVHVVSGGVHLRPLRLAAVVDHGVQRGGGRNEPRQVGLERAEGESQDDVDQPPVDHLLGTGGGEATLARAGSPADEHQPLVGAGSVCPLQRPVEGEGLIGVQAPAAGADEPGDVQRLLPPADGVEDGGAGGSEQHGVAVLLQKLDEVAQQEQLVEAAVAGQPVAVGSHEGRRVDGLEQQGAGVGGVLLDYHQAIGIDTLDR